VKNALETWDCYLNDANEDGYYDDPGLTIFQTWYDIVYDKILLDELSILVKDYAHSLLLHILQGNASKLILRYKHYLNDSMDSVLLDALNQTLSVLESHYGTTNISAWVTPVQIVHFSELGGLASPEMPYMNRGTYNQVIELPRWTKNTQEIPRCGNVLPPGQSGFVNASGIPSTFAFDQLPLYTSWMFKDMHITGEVLLLMRKGKTI
jgi:penicillin amidase